MDTNIMIYEGGFTMKTLIIQMGLIFFMVLYLVLPDLMVGPVDDIILAAAGIVTTVILQKKKNGK